MQEIVNNWKFRYLNIFGKLTVIRTYMLPQLTHVATVVPTLNAKHIDEIHRLWNEFIHAGSPNVVNLKIIYTSIKENGLGLHKVANFWEAVKLSWLQRLPYSKSLWKSLHKEETGNTMYDPITYNLDLLCSAKQVSKTLCGRKFTRI